MEGLSSASRFRSISLPSSETIQSGLVGLAELYVYVDELVQSPQTQQALLRKQNDTLVEDISEGSIGLLDLCSTLKELIMAKKSIIKSLGTLKHLEKKMGSILFLDADHHVLTISKVIRELNSLTISIFKYLLIFMSTKSKPVNGVHLLSKSAYNNEIKNVEVQMSIKKLQILDVSIDRIETGLDLLFRRLLQKDPDVKDKQESQYDPNIAIPDQGLEESTLHKSNKVEETDITSPDMVVAEDLGQKHLHDFDETAMLLMTDKDDDLCNAATDGGDDTVESGDISILNSLIGHESPRSLQLCGTIGTTEVLIHKEVDKEVQYDVYTLHILIPFLKRLNDQYIKKKKMKAVMQRRLWDPRIKKKN
ncbi:class II heat shock protein [Tanacetum coccineum]